MFASLGTVFYGLASALVWGTGDFFGGLASKKNSALKVVLVSQLIGGVLLLICAFLFQEVFVTGWPLLLGAFAGVSGALALLAFYTGLSSGQMAVFAPLTAVITSTIPIIVASFTEGRPATLQIVGFAIAVIAVWLLSSGGNSGGNSGDNPDGKSDGKSDTDGANTGDEVTNDSLNLSKGNTAKGIFSNTILLALLAGLGFSGFFILIDAASEASVFWPLVAARIASVSLFFVILRVRTGSVDLSIVGLIFVVLVAFFDAGGNALYAMAARTGRLDIASVLASLFPVSTIFLAWIVLKEKLVSIQWVGVVLALIAIVFIAL